VTTERLIVFADSDFVGFTASVVVVVVVVPLGLPTSRLFWSLLFWSSSFFGSSPTLTD